MITVGIDQSYTSTGLVGFNGTEILEACIITSDPSQTVYERVDEISTKICHILHGGCIDKIAIEGLAFGMRGNATRDLAGLQFVIIDRLTLLGYKVEVVSPKTLKKHATAKGNATKQEMYEAMPDKAQQLFCKVPVTKGRYDLTDAFWLADYIQ